MAVLISAYFTKAKLQEMLNAADKGIAVTIAVNDEANQYQQNVVISKSQTKDERDAKAAKTYYGNGQVVWTDGKVTLAPKNDAPQQQPGSANTEEFTDLPF